MIALAIGLAIAIVCGCGLYWGFRNPEQQRALRAARRDVRDLRQENAAFRDLTGVVRGRLKYYAPTSGECASVLDDLDTGLARIDKAAEYAQVAIRAAAAERIER
jgi:hypothetical protein